jgi:hypothetical protein
MIIGAKTMLSYAKLKNKPRVFRALTGLSLTGFEKLLPAFGAAWESYIWEHNIQGKNRQRQYGGGRIPQLSSLEDKLAAILNLRMDNGWKKRIEKRENRKKSQERFSLCREY